MDFIVFPDWQGQACNDGFAEALHSVAPHAVIVPALNGPDPAPLASSAEAATSPWCSPVVTGPGFNRAVLAGLVHALNLAAGQACRVVRLDTAEHDLALIPAALAALDHADVAVLDLTFDASTLRAGSVDEFHNLHVIPEIVACYTGGRLRLSGAHGFMALRGHALAQLIPDVTAALDRAGWPCWGGDTLLPVLAARRGLDVEVVAVPATTLRDREGAKCVGQVRDTLAVLRAADACSTCTHDA